MTAAELTALVSLLALAAALWKVALRPPQALLIALGFLALLEVELRVAESIWPSNAFQRQPAPASWRLRSNLRDFPISNQYGTTTLVSTNDLGLREIEVPIAKQPNEFRILCLGDSWTFGQGMAASATFSKVMEKTLQTRHPSRSVSVVNGGQPGYNCMQGRILLEWLLPKYHPDLVCLCGFNPLRDARTFETQDSPQTRYLHASRLYLLLLREAERLPIPAHQQYQGQVDEATRTCVRDMVAVVRNSGARTILCRYFNRALRRAPDGALLGISNQPGLLIADMDKEMAPSLSKVYMQERDWDHPSEAGHARIAELLVKLIEDNELL